MLNKKEIIKEIVRATGSNKNIVYFSKKNKKYFGGVIMCNETKSSVFLNEILILHGFNLSQHNKCCQFLESKRAKNIQIGKLKSEFIKPVLSWSINRGIKSSRVIIKLVRLKINGAFDDIATYLDNQGNYSYQALIFASYNVLPLRSVEKHSKRVVDTKQ